MEFMKLMATIVRLGGQVPHLDYVTLRQSLRFLVPSFLYALNNNIYLVGLTMVTPPIWMILCSIRTFFTANVYKVSEEKLHYLYPHIEKFILNRNISAIQYVGSLCIVASIIIAKLDDVLTESGNPIPSLAFLLAMIGCCNSVVAAVYTETLFKVRNIFAILIISGFIDQNLP